MQPDSELNKRSRKRHGTPTSIKEMENLDKHRLPAGGISTPTVSSSLIQKNEMRGILT